jgi:DNA-binding response OmpR family regulator
MCKRILLADHDDSALTGLTNLFEEMGYEVASARTRDETLQTIARFLPGVVIVECAMPGMERVGTARELRACSPDHPMLLIALTGWGQPQQRDLTLAAGFDVHLVKPVSVDQLRFILSMTDA